MRIELQDPQGTAKSLRNIQHSLNLLLSVAIEYGAGSGLTPALDDLDALNYLAGELEDYALIEAA